MSLSISNNVSALAAQAALDRDQQQATAPAQPSQATGSSAGTPGVVLDLSGASRSSSQAAATQDQSDAAGTKPSLTVAQEPDAPPAPGTLADAQAAANLANVTSQQIKLDPSTALASSSHQSPATVLSLLHG